MELIKWDKIRYQIETAKDIAELTSLKDKLRAYQILAEQSKQSNEVQAKIAIYKARADRKCGEWLKENVKRGNEKGSNQRDIVKSKDITLQSIGINKNESSRLQRIADIPENRFENILEDAETQVKKVTNNMLVNIAREADKKKRDLELKNKNFNMPDGEYQVIYADPPWEYGDKQNTDKLGGAKKHYPVMSIEELCKITMPKTAENAVLFLWVTSPLLEESFEVINAWGFKYKTSFIWDKVKHNMGHYNSVRHELLLLATKGSCTPDNIKLFDSVQSIEKKEHSQKPIEFYEIIETLYNGNKIEMFARNKREGWASWGNESC